MKEIKTINHKTATVIETIDSKELAYIVGFTCADAFIDQTSNVEYSVKLEDVEIVNFISSCLMTTVNIDNTFIKERRRFPRARFTRSIKDILSFVKSRKKSERILPIIKKELNKYLIQGFFDGDGCITWGRRKDRNRLWQKISFTSSIKMLIHVQKILQKELNISTIIHPKQDEKTYVLEFSAKDEVLKFLNWVYSDDFVILKRKFDNYNALRLELGEFGETVDSVIPSRANDHLLEGVETSGGK